MQANEKDFASFTKTVLDMMPAWEKDWKEFCDASQDLEEDRLDFMKDIVWMYANAVSTLCVSDDQVRRFPLSPCCPLISFSALVV